MHFLLEGFVAHIRKIMQNALEDSDEVVDILTFVLMKYSIIVFQLDISEEDSVLHSKSAMAPTNLCIKVC